MANVSQNDAKTVKLLLFGSWDLPILVNIIYIILHAKSSLSSLIREKKFFLVYILKKKRVLFCAPYSQYIKNSNIPIFLNGNRPILNQSRFLESHIALYFA